MNYDINRPYIPTPNYQDDGNRFFPFFPFLTGALIGGAAVGLARPRPIVAYPYQSYPIYPPYYRPYPYYY